MTDKTIARVKGNDMPISTKHAIEICSFIKGKDVAKAKSILTSVMDQKFVIPLKRFKHKRGHKKGKIGPGFYPVKASKYFVGLLNTLEANAKNIGLNAEGLVIDKVIANKGPKAWHYSRHRGRVMKRSCVEIFAKEAFLKKNLQEKTGEKSFNKTEKANKENVPAKTEENEIKK
ncbi:50S ribosomal protein L22 [Candidatus Woesearchaeota archaeon]|nr:50S ribosomal protein L22 [Candidatus Woesearchaeota archaeon]